MARIIIVDDDDLITEIACDALDKAGHITSSVEDGALAAQAIEAGEPDLVILDYELPNTTGMAILRQLRALPRTSTIPIMMLTATTGRLLKLRAEDTGVSAYMVKPFHPQDLVEQVEALLAEKASLAA
jgi:two-component system, OmpR family, phosphate regulon response regulator PhoB